MNSSPSTRKSLFINSAATMAVMGHCERDCERGLHVPDSLLAVVQVITSQPVLLEAELVGYWLLTPINVIYWILFLFPICPY